MKTIIKTPCGMRDYDNNIINTRNHIVKIIRQCYESFNGKEIDTPIMELQSTIHQLYGSEFNKLVYNIERKNNTSEEERLMLRYDLTVPFVRYAVEKGIKLFKRMQIGMVYRKDNPQMNIGRYRSFMQADFDILGDDQQTQIHDVEILDLLHYTLNELLGNNFTIFVNHKIIVLNMLNFCGVDINDNEQVKMISSGIDRLDKNEWSTITNDLLEKGIDPQILKKIGALFDDEISLDIFLSKSIITIDIYNDMINIFKKLELLGVEKSFVFDPKIVRGMDYYTGLIYEVKYNDTNVISSSIAAGGRYDDLMSKMGNHDIKAIGLSIGIDRIMTIYEKNNEMKSEKSLQWFVARIHTNNNDKDDQDILDYSIKVCSMIRRKGFSCEMNHTNKPSIKKQLTHVLQNNIPQMLIIGKDEVNSNSLMLKYMKDRKQNNMSFDFFFNNIELLTI